MIEWQFYPNSTACPKILKSVVDAFFEVDDQLASESNHGQSSDEALAILRPGLEALEFEVETGKRADQKIDVPVLFGRNGSVAKSFQADAYHRELGVVIEVEAGRAIANYAFLKDLFEACMMHDVEYLVVAVRRVYTSGKNASQSKDFERIATFLETLYASGRLSLPLSGVLLVGY